MKSVKVLFLVGVLTFLALVIDLPKTVTFKSFRFDRPNLSFSVGDFHFFRDLEIKLGLDLAGGSRLVFEADVANLTKEDRSTAVEAAKANIEKRINLFGVSEASVQTSQVGDSYRVIVELPGVRDVNQAIELIGKTAQLTFAEIKEVSDNKATPSARIVPTDLTGRDLVKAQVQFDPNTSKPVVALTFSQEGGKKFADITKRNIGKNLPIVLDDQIISSPVVREEINSGKAVISGDFSTSQAKQLAVELNAGALPVSIHLIEQRTIGATLGAESIQKSVRAGIVGLAAIFLFMVAYYGRLGLLASIGLLIYGILTLAIYKLIPIFLTLPGITGFMLSVGMAVDANILVFSRMQEELRRSVPWKEAMERGFNRAWNSIRDAYISTLMTCFVLFNPLNWSFLHTSGPVRGFALTLAMGILISLFTSIVITRALLRTFSRSGKAQ